MKMDQNGDESFVPFDREFDEKEDEKREREREVKRKRILFSFFRVPLLSSPLEAKPIRIPTRRTRNIKESARLLMQKCKGIQYDGVIIWKVQLSFGWAGELFE